MEMHEIVAECMIFANQWVAKRIHQSIGSAALVSKETIEKGVQLF